MSSDDSTIRPITFDDLLRLAGQATIQDAPILCRTCGDHIYFTVAETWRHVEHDYEIEWDHEGGARFYYQVWAFEEALVKEFGERP